MLLAVYALISALALLFVHRLDRQATATLADFLRQSGVEVDGSQGLIGIMSEIRAIRARLDSAKCQERALIEAQTREELATQVAHDIRSPLTALGYALADIDGLPESRRGMVRSALGRIQDITSTLTDRNQPHTTTDVGEPAATAGEPAGTHMLVALIERVVAEQRLPVAGSPIAIELQAENGGYGLFARVQPVEFQRVVSNLLTNAIEALAGRGNVTVQLKAQAGELRIDVEDSGCGMSPEVLSRIGRRGETFGKSSGSGLGLYHAKSRVSEWGGKLELRSRLGAGTTVSLILPQASSPRWFVPSLRVDPGVPVVILDDEPSVHAFWDARFGDLKLPAEIVHFASAEELFRWRTAQPDVSEFALLLIDYDLQGPDTGLCVIAEFGSRARAFLVTSRAADTEVLAECERLSVGLIPKSLAGVVPIGVSSGELFDAVLIDNEPLTRRLWMLAAEEHGKTLRTFSGPEAFLEGAPDIDMRCPIYIDSRLDHGDRGEQFAKHLYDLGFRTLYLATGQAPNAFPKMPWITGIVGKFPPWRVDDPAEPPVPAASVRA